MKFSVSLLKKNALDLYSLGQLPKALCKYIIDLSNDSPKDLIELLKDLSAHYLRIRGYYKKYSNAHKDINDHIIYVVDNFKKERGY